MGGQNSRQVNIQSTNPGGVATLNTLNTPLEGKSLANTLTEFSNAGLYDDLAVRGQWAYDNGMLIFRFILEDNDLNQDLDQEDINNDRWTVWNNTRSMIADLLSPFQKQILSYQTPSGITITDPILIYNIYRYLQSINS